MTCSLQRNNEGNIIGVMTPEGKPSALFQNIHSNLFGGTVEDSVKLTNLAYSRKVRDLFQESSEFTYETGEPRMYMKDSLGREVTDIEDWAISDTKGDIQMGFKNPTTGEFIPVAKFKTEGSPLPEFLTGQVKQGVLSGRRVLMPDGTTRLEAKGTYAHTRKITAIMAKQAAFTELAAGNAVAYPDGTLALNLSSDKVIARMSNGTTRMIDMEEIPEVAPDALNGVDLQLLYEQNQNGTNRSTSVDEKSLQNRLFDFLRSVGFSTTSLDAYRKRYQTLYGKDPDIQAIADIANRVVAFGEKQLTDDNLAEETAHVALELYSEQASIIEALTEVANTPEYAEHAEYYRQKYAPFFEGDNLEEHVRKEILGKILAKQIQNRFKGPETYFNTKLKKIWQIILDFFRGAKKPFHSKMIAELNEEVIDNILSTNKDAFQNDISSSNAFYYNAMSEQSKELHNNLMKAKIAVEVILTERGEKMAEKYGLDRIEQMENAITEQNLVLSVNTISGIAQKKMSQVERRLKAIVKEGKGEILDNKTEGIARSLNDNILPLLERMVVSLEDIKKNSSIENANEKAAFQASIDKIISSIKSTRSRNSDVQPLISTGKLNRAKELYESQGFKEQMTPEQAAKEDKAFYEGDKDDSLVSKWFGMMSESSNPLIKLLSLRINNMYHKAEMLFLPKANRIATKHTQLNWSNIEAKIIQKDENGKYTHFFISPYRFHAEEAALEAKKIELLVQISGKSIETVKASLKKEETIETILENDQQRDQYLDAIKEYKEAQLERRMKPEYYEKRKKDFLKHKTSEVTQSFLGIYSSRTAEINQPYYDRVTGLVDKSKMTEEDKQLLADIRKEREIMKSPFSAANEIREGIRIVKVTDLSEAELDALERDFGYRPDLNYKGDLVVLERDQDLENLSEETRIALDMNNIAYGFIFSGETNTKTPSEAFNEKIREMTLAIQDGTMTVEEVREWVFSNSTVSFSDSYYENIGESSTYKDDVKNYIDSLEPREARKRRIDLENYEKVGQKIKYLLKQNKSIGNTVETDVYNMDEKTRKALLSLEEELEKLRDRIKLPKEFRSEKNTNDSERYPSSDFEKKAQEAGMAVEGKYYEFALSHMTTNKQKRVTDFSKSLSRMLDGDIARMPKSFEKYLADLAAKGKVNTNMTKEQVHRIATDAYAMDNLARYFTVSTPANFKSAVESLGVDVAFETFFSNRELANQTVEGLENVSIIPDYTWLQNDNNEEMVNPLYKKTGYHKQLNNKWLNEEFFTTFGVSKKEYLENADDDLKKLTPPTNKEQRRLWDMYLEVIDIKEQVLENQDETDTQNKYLRFQISKTSNNLKSIGREFFQNRADEKAQGETVNGKNFITNKEDTLRVIPKYSSTRLEDPSEVTDNTFSAALTALKQSILYKERKATENDARALLEQAKEQKNEQFGASRKRGGIKVKGEVSNALFRMKEFIDHNIYGVRQTRPFFATIPVLNKEIDITKALTGIQKVSVFFNLGYNFFVDLTGATTGRLNNSLDRLAGDYFHKSSVRMARAQAITMSGAYIKELGNMQRNSYLGHLMELTGIQDSLERTKRSKYGKGVRLLERTPFLGSHLSNLAVMPEILLSAVNDTRYHNGKFVGYHAFVAIRKNEGVESKEDIEQEWISKEKDSLKNLMKQTEFGLEPNSRFQELFPENTEEAFEDATFKLAAKVQKIVMNADSVLNNIDQVAAQRDVLTNTVMQHFGWMVINLTRKFKREGFNYTTGAYEEGQYRSFINMLVNGAKEFSTTGKISFKKYEDYKVRNFKRSFFETAIATAMLLLGKAILASDDDDDSPLENLSQLIYLRTVSEFNSSTYLGIPGALMDKVKSPIPSFSLYQKLNPFTLAKKFTEEDKEGRNKGLEAIIKGTILRRTRQYSDLQEQIDAYRYYNDATLFNLGSIMTKEEKEEAAAALNENHIPVTTQRLR